MKPLALIVGSAGQDGQVLSQLLQLKSYEVIGLGRGDIELTNVQSVDHCISLYKPDKIFFLAAFHHSSENFHDQDIFSVSMDTHCIGVVNFLNAISKHSPTTKFFYAASSHIFGVSEEHLQNENTPLEPDSIYGITKAAGVMACRHYRKEKNVFASVGILYNHESPYRKLHFVSKKIIHAAVVISNTKKGQIKLGDLDAKVDWGYAPDYVDAMHRILQMPIPKDYIIATGQLHSVRDFARIAFEAVGLDYLDYLISEPQVLLRKNLVRVGDATHLKKDTGWMTSVTFKEMVTLLVQMERKYLNEERIINFYPNLQ